MLRSVAAMFHLFPDDARLIGGGFSGAEVFQVTMSDGRMLAFRKMAQHVALPDERLRALHRLLSDVHQSGLAEIPVPLFPDETRTDPWVRVGENAWQVEPWMPGTALRGSAVSPACRRSALERLRKFHAAAAGNVAAGNQSAWFRNSMEPSPAVLRRRDITVDLLNGQSTILRQKAATDPDADLRNFAARIFRVLDHWLPWLHSELTHLAVQSFSIQPVLRDVWRAHVLFTEDRVTGLIDLSAAASDHVAVDAARLLRSWFGIDTARMLEAAAEFEAGYGFKRNERRLLRALDASSVLLSPVTWIRRRSAAVGSSRCSPEMLSRLEELTSVAEAFEMLPWE